MAPARASGSESDPRRSTTESAAASEPVRSTESSSRFSPGRQISNPEDDSDDSNVMEMQGRSYSVRHRLEQRGAIRAFLLQILYQRRVPVLAPTGPFVRAWRPIVLTGVIIAVAMAPFDIAFYFWTPPEAYILFAKILDVLFIVDLVLNFNIGYIHRSHVVYDRRRIAVHYSKTWLLPDFVSNFPLDWLVGSDGKSRKMLKMLKLPKVLRFVKLLRVLKSQTQYVGVASTVGGIWFSAHYYTCFWALSLVGDCDFDCPDVLEAYMEGFSVSISTLSGSDAWSRFMAPGTTSHLAVGRDDGQPVLPREDLMAGFMALGGFVILACLFANVHHALDHMTGVGRARAFEMARRKAEMRAARIPDHLQHKVIGTYEHRWRFGGQADDMIRDPTLSLDLRRRLALSLYGPALRRVPIFKDMKSRLLKCLAQKVEVRLYTPGDLLVLIGEVGSELFVIMSGSVEPVDDFGNHIREAVLSQGEYFGEICFLQPGTRRTASIRSIDFCKVIVLTIECFRELHMLDVLDSIRAQAQSFQKPNAPPGRWEVSIGSSSVALVDREDGVLSPGPDGSESWAAGDPLSPPHVRPRTSVIFRGDLAADGSAVSPRTSAAFRSRAQVRNGSKNTWTRQWSEDSHNSRNSRHFVIEEGEADAGGDRAADGSAVSPRTSAAFRSQAQVRNGSKSGSIKRRSREGLSVNTMQPMQRFASIDSRSSDLTCEGSLQEVPEGTQSGSNPGNDFHRAASPGQDDHSPRPDVRVVAQAVIDLGTQMSDRMRMLEQQMSQVQEGLSVLAGQIQPQPQPSGGNSPARGESWRPGLQGPRSHALVI